MSICTNQKEEDFFFSFLALKNAVKLIFNYDYKPSILIADAASAITNGFIKAFDYQSLADFTRVTCWAHVLREIDNNLPNSIPEREKILINKCLLFFN